MVKTFVKMRSGSEIQTHRQKGKAINHRLDKVIDTHLACDRDRFPSNFTADIQIGELTPYCEDINDTH